MIGTTGIIFALLEINFSLTFFADVLPVELIGEDLNFRAAIIAFAHKRRQVSQFLKTRTMSRCIHFFLLCSTILGYGANLKQAFSTNFSLILSQHLRSSKQGQANIGPPLINHE
jgi:hypothetical protein